MIDIKEIISRIEAIFDLNIYTLAFAALSLVVIAWFIIRSIRFLSVQRARGSFVQLLGVTKQHQVAIITQDGIRYTLLLHTAGAILLDKRIQHPESEDED